MQFIKAKLTVFGPSVSIPFLEDDLEPFSSGGVSSFGGSGGGGGGCKKINNFFLKVLFNWFTNLQIQYNKLLILASNEY